MFRTAANDPLRHLPEQFVVFDLETTGLDSSKNEIIEIAGIRVNRNSTKHDFIQGLVKPEGKLPPKIVQLTGITQSMLDQEGEQLEDMLKSFISFIGNLRLVSYNADFDMAFLRTALLRCEMPAIRNPVSCALKMARKAWPGRKSYRLEDIARDGNLDTGGLHRALADSQTALTVYTTAASILRTVS